MFKLIRNGIGFWGPDRTVGPMHLLVDGDTIAAVSRNEIPAPEGARVYDLNGRLLLPGFVDAHTHLAQSYGRGIYDNRHLTQWLWTMIRYLHLDEDETYTAAQLACIEALKSGTTTVAEMTSLGVNVDASVQAIADCGLRGVVSSCLGDYREGDNPEPSLDAKGVLDEMRRLHRQWHNSHEGRITVRLSPVGLPACSEELMRGTRALADELDVGIHTHCCEGEAETQNAYERFGCSEVEALGQFGVLGPDVQLVHCVWLTDRDRQLIAERGSHVVHCPSTNLKITDGLPRMVPLQRLGVNIALGCDGQSSSGSYDLLKEARLASLLGKGLSADAAAFPAETVLDMITRNGARAIGLGETVGELTVGHKADITVINYPQVHLIDEQRLLSNLIYAGEGADVDSVLVNGEVLMWHRELLHLDEQAILAKALVQMRRAGRILPR
ncbi:MAG TPA: amidohydrolase [Anaerolineae bacterium]|nr:amidohydrolase [Anaerolineae bacterium]